VKSLKDIHPPDDLIRCDCGSCCFFDWGVKVIVAGNYGKSPRCQDYTTTDNVQICAGCLKPVMVKDGDIYDASDYVSANQVRDILKRGQTKEHVVPERVMDP
jgi:hypothetical protein